MPFIHLHLPNNDRLFGWTAEKIDHYIQSKPLNVGDKMIIVNGQGGFSEYVLAEVVNPCSGPQRRVILSLPAAYGGSSFYPNGKNCFAAKSKSTMIPPTPELMDHLKEVGQRIAISPTSRLNATYTR